MNSFLDKCQKHGEWEKTDRIEYLLYDFPCWNSKGENNSSAMMESRSVFVKPLVSGRCWVRKSYQAPCWGDLNALYPHCDGCFTAIYLWQNSSNCLKNSLVHWYFPESIRYSGMGASPGSQELRVTQRPESVPSLGGKVNMYASLEPSEDLSGPCGVLWILGEMYVGSGLARD